MIISECQINIPGKKYKTKVSCVSTRRLTTIEWLILRCTKKFSSPLEKNYSLRQVFEQVFKFQNSELLIKPCLENLESIKVIKIKSGDKYDYNTLRFSDIILTELGQAMLNDGLLPGEEREIPLEVFYNPLTGKVSTYDMQSDSKTSIDFGTESDYDLSFPEERIVNGLQSGVVASGKFTAAKFRIENIEELSEAPWMITTDLSIDLDKNGNIHTIPDIIEQSVYNRIELLLASKDISDSLLNKLVPLNEIEIGNIKGSGHFIKDEIQDICKNSKALFISSDFYEAYKRNTTFYKNKIVVIYGCDSELSIEIKKDKKDTIYFIKIPDMFIIPGVEFINEKEDSLSVCRATWQYKGNSIVAPVVVEDKRMTANNKMLTGWISNLLDEKMSIDSRYMVLALLPGIVISNKFVLGKAKELWKDSSVEDISTEIRKVIDTCEQIGVIPSGLTALNSLWEEKLDYQNPEHALDQLEIIVDAGIISKKSKKYQEIVGGIVEIIPKPQSYSDLVRISQKIGVYAYDNTISIAELENELYTIDVIRDVLCAIVEGRYSPVPKYYNWDIFFNEYYSCIKYVEAHISNLNIFNMADEAQIKEGIEKCPDIGSLQMYFSELITKNDYFINNKIDIYKIISQIDESKGKAYVENISKINQLLNTFIASEYDLTKANYVKDGKTAIQKVYVIDTCALIHNPNILLYFNDDDLVRIPTKVIDELGKIKDNRSEKYNLEASSVARNIARNINEEYLGLFNADNKIRLLIENADTTLLPEDLDPQVPDNQILSVALKYSDCDTTIISDDNVFALASISQNIKTISSSEYIKENESNKKTIDSWKEKVNKVPLVSLPEGKHDLQDEIEKAKTNSEVDIDSLPIRELMKYAPELTNPVMSLLVANSIKTVGQFRSLTLQTADSLKAKGKQSIHKKAIKRAISNIDVIIEKMNQSSDITQ